MASDFTQCQYLTTENSMPCNIPVISRGVCVVDSSAQSSTVRFLQDPGLKWFRPLYTTYSDYKETQSSHLQKNPPTLQYRGQTTTMISHVVWRDPVACLLGITLTFSGESSPAATAWRVPACFRCNQSDRRALSLEGSFTHFRSLFGGLN